VEDVFEIYKKVWCRAQADKTVWVHYGYWLEEGLAGYFDPRENRDRPMKPEIAIWRPYPKEPMEEPTRESNAPPDKPQPDLVAELHTLAHEYGHSQSWAGRTPPDEYKLYYAIAKRRDEVVAEEKTKLPKGLSLLEINERLRRAVYARLDDDAHRRVIDEEALAWNIGREVLAEFEYPGLATYDAIIENRLHNHRYLLGMEDAWPGDDLGVTTE
jgi:hypothetical protein